MMDNKTSKVDIYSYYSDLVVPPCFENQKIGLFGESLVDVVAKNFWVTSGDAFQKSKYVMAFYTKYSQNAKKQHKKIDTKESKEFVDKCLSQISATKKIIQLFEELRGPSVFLETFYADGFLVLSQKNPRTKKSVHISI